MQTVINSASHHVISKSPEMNTQNEKMELRSSSLPRNGIDPYSAPENSEFDPSFESIKFSDDLHQHAVATANIFPVDLPDHTFVINSSFVEKSSTDKIISNNEETLSAWTPAFFLYFRFFVFSPVLGPDFLQPKTFFPISFERSSLESHNKMTSIDLPIVLSPPQEWIDSPFQSELVPLYTPPSGDSTEQDLWEFPMDFHDSCHATTTSRRYSEIISLRNLLMYSFPHRVIPSLRLKSAIDNFNVYCHSIEVLRVQQRAIGRFLKELSMIPEIICHTPLVAQFFTETREKLEEVVIPECIYRSSVIREAYHRRLGIRKSFFFSTEDSDLEKPENSNANSVFSTKFLSSEANMDRSLQNGLGSSFNPYTQVNLEVSNSDLPSSSYFDPPTRLGNAWDNFSESSDNFIERTSGPVGKSFLISDDKSRRRILPSSTGGRPVKAVIFQSKHAFRMALVKVQGWFNSSKAHSGALIASKVSIKEAIAQRYVTIHEVKRWGNEANRLLKLRKVVAVATADCHTYVMSIHRILDAEVGISEGLEEWTDVLHECHGFSTVEVVARRAIDAMLHANRARIRERELCFVRVYERLDYFLMHLDSCLEAIDVMMAHWWYLCELLILQGGSPNEKIFSAYIPWLDKELYQDITIRCCTLHKQFLSEIVTNLANISSETAHSIRERFLSAQLF